MSLKSGILPPKAVELATMLMQQIIAQTCIATGIFGLYRPSAKLLGGLSPLARPPQELRVC